MSDDPVVVEFGGGCCFCGLAIPPTDKDPCRITVETAEGLWQVWFCLARCFRDLLAEDEMFDSAHL